MNEKRKTYRALLAGASLETITADDLPGAMCELARRYPDLPTMGWYRASRVVLEGRIGDFGFKIEEVAR